MIHIVIDGACNMVNVHSERIRTSTLHFWRFTDSSEVSLKAGALGQPSLCAVGVSRTGETGDVDRQVHPSITTFGGVRKERMISATKIMGGGGGGGGGGEEEEEEEEEKELVIKKINIRISIHQTLQFTSTKINENLPPSSVMMVALLTVLPLVSVAWADTPFSPLTITTYRVNGLRPVIRPEVTLTRLYTVTLSGTPVI